MTYYGPKEMAASFRTVRGNTIKIAEEIPEESYGFRAAPECRSVAETLVHIAMGPRFQEQIHLIERRDTLSGFDFFAFLDKIVAEEQVTRSKAQILELLRAEGEKFAQALDGLSEAFLVGPKEHEMRHRGQLMLVQRMLGKVPHLTRQMQERVAAMKAASAQTA